MTVQKGDDSVLKKDGYDSSEDLSWPEQALETGFSRLSLHSGIKGTGFINETLFCVRSAQAYT